MDDVVLSQATRMNITRHVGTPYERTNDCSDLRIPGSEVVGEANLEIRLAFRPSSNAGLHRCRQYPAKARRSVSKRLALDDVTV